MKAKKIISVILTGIVAASMLAGCGSSSKSQTDNTESSSQNEASSSSASETADATEDSENTETTESTDTSENTETPTPAETDDSSETAVADDTESTGKTLVVYYSATGTTEGVAQTIAVSREHDDESLRDVDLVSTSVDNWDSYDTVFIGYPIWWGIAAWPVDGFVEANDFTGKAVIPFCTAASSGIGDSGNLLEEMAGTGNWLEGKRLDRGISEDEVKDWISDLGISSVEN